MIPGHRIRRRQGVAVLCFGGTLVVLAMLPFTFHNIRVTSPRI